MIISKIRGGLGNQLFTYAAGRSLALENDTELMLDVSWYATGGRELLLNNFCISGSTSELDRSDAADGIGFNQTQWEFDPRFRRPGKHRFLSGWWQSERYFEPHAETIRKDLRLRDGDVVLQAQRLVEMARPGNAAVVSVHCRRGDYVGLADQGRFHLVGSGYYDTARSLFSSTTRFLVFSDDAEWCEEHLADSRTQVVDVEDPILSFAAMQSCDHHIITNSTFSWWAAWLSETQDTVVVTPPVKRWFGPELAKVHNTTDVVPTRWIQVEPAPGWHEAM